MISHINKIVLKCCVVKRADLRGVMMAMAVTMRASMEAITTREMIIPFQFLSSSSAPTNS